jgi:hypothetical protein
LDPDLIKSGLSCQHLGTSSSEDSSLFHHEERHAIKVRLTAKNAAVENKDLAYTIYDEKKAKLSEGALSGPAALKAGENAEFEIVDLKIPKAHRVVIRKKG